MLVSHPLIVFPSSSAILASRLHLSPFAFRTFFFVSRSDDLLHLWLQLKSAAAEQSFLISHFYKKMEDAIHAVKNPQMTRLTVSFVFRPNCLTLTWNHVLTVKQLLHQPESPHTFSRVRVCVSLWRRIFRSWAVSVIQAYLHKRKHPHVIKPSQAKPARNHPKGTQQFLSTLFIHTLHFEKLFPFLVIRPCTRT